MRSLVRRLPLVVFFFFLSGCTQDAGIIRPAQPGRELVVSTPPSGSIGQSFVAEFDGLQRIGIYLASGTAPTGRLKLTLVTGGVSGEVLRESSASPDASGSMTWFEFEPIEHSNLQTYRAVFEQVEGGSFGLFAAEGRMYANGAAYLDGKPVDMQLAFSLAYHTARAATGLLRLTAAQVLWLVAGGFAFILPGWVLLDMGWKGWDRQSRFSRIGLAAGVGLAFYPVLFVWLDMAGFHGGAWQAWIPGVVSAAIILYRYRAGITAGAIRRQTAPVSFDDYIYTGILLLVVMLIVLSRFWVIRSVVAPLWGDSYQHSVMTQRILENGGLFEDWMPYTPYRSLTIHSGFHVFSAILGWLMRTDGAEAVLFGGQVLNIFSVLVLAPLAEKISGGRRWAGLGAVAFAGLFTAMPAFYVNWGRFSQLMGQSILPAALWLLWDALERSTDESPRSLLPGIFIAGSALAGMLLAYYRMPFYYATFAVLLIPGWALPVFKTDFKKWLRAGLTGLATGAAALLLFAPWALRLFDSALAGAIESGFTTSFEIENVVGSLRNWRNVYLYMPQYILIGVVVIALLALLDKKWMVLVMPLWPVLIVGYQLGQVVNLPGAHMLQHFAIQIWLYMPAAVIAGWALGKLTSLSKQRIWLLTTGVIGTLVLIGYAGQRRQDLNPGHYAMVTQPDLAAMDWIRDHVDPGARFLVQGFRIYNGASIVGSDAGWWLPLYTQRQNTIPPQYALLNEQPTEADFNTLVVSGVAALEENSLASDAGLEALCDQDITHVYNGQKRGLVGDALTRSLFTGEDAARQPALTLIYAEDRVQIFEVDRQYCKAGR